MMPGDVKAPVSRPLVSSRSPGILEMPRARLAWLGVAAVVLASLAIALIPAEWSLVDDAGLKTQLNAQIQSHGLIGGIWSAFSGYASSELTHGGQFRPLAYVYWSTFYLLSPGFGHGVRMAMFLVSVTIPPIMVASRFQRSVAIPIAVWGISLLLVNSTLYQGLTLMSLQELVGVAVIALGFTIPSSTGKGIAWLTTGWMRTPFVWLSIAWGAWLAYKRETRWQGLLLVILGIGTIAISALLARSGDYTSRYSLSVAQAVAAIRSSISLFAWPVVILLLGFLALRVDVRRLGWRDPVVIAVAFAGFAYYATLLPWGDIYAYHTAPVIWLLSVAAISLIAPAARPIGGTLRPVAIASVIATVIAATRIVYLAGGLQFDRNLSLVGLRDWALSLPSSGLTIGVNGDEAAVRIPQLVRLHQPAWANTVTWVTDTDETVAVDYYIWLHEQGPGNRRLETGPIQAFPSTSIFAP